MDNLHEFAALNEQTAQVAAERTQAGQWGATASTDTQRSAKQVELKRQRSDIVAQLTTTAARFRVRLMTKKRLTFR